MPAMTSDLLRGRNKEALPKGQVHRQGYRLLSIRDAGEK